MKRLALALLGSLAACGTFEDPSIVLDLRVVGMVTEPPDQLVAVDFADPMATELLDQLEPVTVTAYVADPDRSRELRWSMTLCLTDGEGRCDLAKPYKDLGGGVIADPDEAPTAQHPRAMIYPDVTMLAMLQRAIEDEPVQALGGVELVAMLRVGGVDESPELDLFAAKYVRVSPRFSATQLPNVNPRIDFLDAARGSIGVQAPRRRCSDPGVMSELQSLSPGDVITLFPIEPTGVRETYMVPTLDGKFAELQEAISYQWLARAGSWSDETTGGGRDLLGNQSLLGSDWTAPPVSGSTLIPIWMIQRDERYGAMVFETCMLVEP